MNFAIDQELLGESIFYGIQKVKLKFPGAFSIVFGSRARGDNNDDCDLAVYVIFQESLEDPFKVIYQLRKELHEHLDLALDVLVSDQAKFDERKTNRTTLEYLVQNEGIAV